MTLEERVGRLEGDFLKSNTANILQSRGALEHMGATEKLEKRVGTLEAQLAELDILVMAIHETIKAVEAKVTEQ